MPVARFHLTLAVAASLAAAALPVAGQDGGTEHGLHFVDVSASIGLDFVHARGNQGDKHLPETIGAGLAWIDYDGDGDDDLYLVQSGPLPDVSQARPGNIMYRNHNGVLQRVEIGAEDPGYGMGVSAADWDNDGFVDLFISNFGPDVLLRNNGDGTYSVQEQAGVEDAGWSASAAWGDLDGDGFADLYVTRYLVYDHSTALPCEGQQRGLRSYCHVDLFAAAADGMYRNNGAGRFENVAISAGVANTTEGKGLGVVIGDVNDDRLADVYVANDTQQNFLYLNRGDWTFDEQGLFSGTGYSESGTGLAGMGTEMRDLDGNGRAEILVTNFAFESNNLYRELVPGAFLDDGPALGFARPGFATLSFGIVAFDADADGDREIAVANGHILDNVDQVQDNTSYPQRNHLFRNDLTALRRAATGSGGALPEGWRPDAGLLHEIGAAAGPGWQLVEVSRGMAVGDLDGDGLLEVGVNNSGGPARVLANRSEDPGHRLIVRLRGRTATRDGLGAVVRVTPIGGDPADGATGFEQTAEARSSSSYMSQDASALHFGLATSPRARVEILWPGGQRQVLEDVAGDATILVIEGSGTYARPLRAPTS